MTKENTSGNGNGNEGLKSNERGGAVGPPIEIDRAKGIEISIHIPGINCYSDIDEAHDESSFEKVEMKIEIEYCRIDREIKQLAAQYGGATWHDPIPPWAGDHYNIVIWFAGAFASGFAWDIFKGFGKRLIELLRDRNNKKIGIKIGIELIIFIAWDEVSKTSAGFRTAWEITQVMVDGTQENIEGDSIIMYTGFPTGIHVVRVPNLETNRTHILEINSNGEVLSHEIRNYLTRDAMLYLEKRKQQEEL